MRRPHRWPIAMRLLIPLAVVAVFFLLYGGWHWHSSRGSGPGVTFSPTRAYIRQEAVLSLVVAAIHGGLQRTGLVPLGLAWDLGYALPVILPAALIAAGIYAALSPRTASPAADGHSHCRRCGYILFGLSEPRCPECGEAV